MCTVFLLRLRFAIMLFNIKFSIHSQSADHKGKVLPIRHKSYICLFSFKTKINSSLY